MLDNQLIPKDVLVIFQPGKGGCLEQIVGMEAVNKGARKGIQLKYQQSNQPGHDKGQSYIAFPESLLLFFHSYPLHP